ALVHKPMNKKHTKDRSRLQAQPKPSLVLRSRQHAHTNSQNNRKSSDPDKRIREPKSFCLFGCHNRPTAKNWADITRWLVVGVFEQLYFFDGQISRRKKPYKTEDH